MKALVLVQRWTPTVHWAASATPARPGDLVIGAVEDQRPQRDEREFILEALVGPNPLCDRLCGLDFLTDQEVALISATTWDPARRLHSGQ